MKQAIPRRLRRTCVQRIRPPGSCQLGPKCGRTAGDRIRPSPGICHRPKRLPPLSSSETGWQCEFGGSCVGGTTQNICQVNHNNKMYVKKNIEKWNRKMLEYTKWTTRKGVVGHSRPPPSRNQSTWRGRFLEPSSKNLLGRFIISLKNTQKMARRKCRQVSTRRKKKTCI